MTRPATPAAGTTDLLRAQIETLVREAVNQAPDPRWSFTERYTNREAAVSVAVDALLAGPVATLRERAEAAETRATATESRLATLAAENEALRKALERIAALSPEPDDKAWRDEWNDPARYRFIGPDGAIGETSVDTDDPGDVEAFGHERGLHSAAMIARAAINRIPGASHDPA